MKRFFYTLLISGVLISCQDKPENQQQESAKPNKRLIVIMFDGFGMSYYNKSQMPYLKEMISKGLFKEVSALMPTVTNANNASICTGTFPEENGITGNTFLDSTGKEEYMEDKGLLFAPTIFERLNEKGIKSALIASKKKSTYLLPKGAEIVLSPETADSSEWIKKLGTPPHIYSSEVNYWSMEAALDILKNRPDV
ncbi:MAG: alkaline phosphatase family protein, partial [Bacteroidia bacterium]|nr:alkaline phosphatase family protein [Bacteroidia bacterium]